MSELEHVLNFLYDLSYNYINLSERLFMDYYGGIDAVVKKYLRLKSVPVHSQYDLKARNGEDYIPLIDLDDSSFPLDLLHKEQFERAFGEDLSRVTIHAGEFSNKVTSKYGAKAVTIGNSIYFAKGMYDPYSEDGLALLAHEIQHVIQYNDKDQSFLFDEDIALAEYMAEVVENQVKNLNLHSINSTVLNSKNDTEGSNSGEINSFDRIEIGNNTNLDDFSSASTDLRYKITLENGKVYNISKKERDQLISSTTESVKSYITDRILELSSEEADEFLLKVMDYISGGFCV